MTKIRWCVLVNPTAGTRGQSAEDVETLAAARGIDAAITTTRSPEHLGSVVEEAAAHGTRGFVAVGGDGTANLVLNAMMQTRLDTGDRLALAIVAAGSGSDFVRTFGHGRGLEAGFDRLAEPDFYPIDIGHIAGTFGERYFLNAVNVGVAAASAVKAARLPKRMGSIRYGIGFWLALGRFSVGSITVTVDRHRFDGKAINVVVANGQFFGGGMNVAPRATLTDGILDVQVFLGPRRQAFTVMPRVVRGTHLTHTGVRRYTGSTIEVSVPSHWPVESDGELLGRGSVSIRTIPSAIDFIA